jgi:hypothetical protein
MSRYFRHSSFTLIALAVLLSTACSYTPSQTESAKKIDTNSEINGETILIVGLEDGSFVRQTVALGADICVKQLDNPTTTCLRQGDAIFNNMGVVVGYEMLSETIELQGLN